MLYSWSVSSFWCSELLQCIYIHLNNVLTQLVLCETGLLILLLIVILFQYISRKQYSKLPRRKPTLAGQATVQHIDREQTPHWVVLMMLSVIKHQVGKQPTSKSTRNSTVQPWTTYLFFWLNHMESSGCILRKYTPTSVMTYHIVGYCCHLALPL